LPLKLSKIDSLSLADHFNLDASDSCYHLGEYTARKGYNFSETNNLLLNLKKKPTAKASELRYKETAIHHVAAALRAALNSAANRDHLRASTLVPTPPSCIADHPLYDDRMIRVLREMGRGLNLDIRELVKQRRSLTPSHECDARPSVHDLMENYYIDEDLALPTPHGIWVFDDLITVGTHYKAMQRTLAQRFPDVHILGIFVARRVPEADPA
jgi:hypothetical protein